jgi:hypothetical protein
VDLGGKEGLLMLGDIGLTHPEQLVDLIDSAIEQNIIVSHVEMTIIVDPGGLDPHHRRHERGKEQRFIVGAVEHSGVLS